MQVAAAFADALRVLAPPSPFAVAVSGGPDSMALMRLAASLKPLVLTVDHGLRAEAADEARLVAEAAGRLGLSHQTLRWEGHKPGAGIQAAAREARYRLLGGACMNAGVRSLMTGHTLDDQIETVAMRRAKGSGAGGLAGMPSQTLLPGVAGGVRLVRPLLAMRKAALVGFLEALGQAFVVDPSNSDRRFDRGRMRVDGGVDIGVEDIVAAQRARVALERAALAFLDRQCERRGRGLIVSREAWTHLPAELADVALVALLRRAGASDYPGTRAARMRVLAAIGESGLFSGRTLAGVILRRASRAENGAVEAVAFVPERADGQVVEGWWLPFAQFPQIGADGASLTLA